MAYRDLTKEFENIRSRYIKPLASSPINDGYHSDHDEYGLRYTSSSSSAAASGRRPLMQDIELGDSDQFQSNQQPQWLIILKGIQDSIAEIKNGLDELKKLQHVHSTFQLKKDFEQEERQVQVQTAKIKELFLGSKKVLELMKVADEPKSEEELMKKNLKISLVNELNDLSRVFRDEQTEYFKSMDRLKSKKRDNKVNYDERGHDDLDPEERQKMIEMEQQLQADPGFTDDQIRQMLDNQADIIRRDKELREILTSIVELNELFKEFSTLVVEQGTLLDRIDYNIETTYESMRSGNENLVTAEKYQKMSGMTLCVLLLIVLVVAFGLFFALKLVLKFSLGGGIIGFL